MATPKLPVILTEVDWNKKKGKLAKLANENGVGRAMAAVKLFYDEVRWSAFDVAQALRPTDTPEQIAGQLALAKIEYLKVRPLLKKLEALEFAAAVTKIKWSKNKLIPKASTLHADKVAKAAKLMAVQTESVQAEFVAFEQAAAGKQSPQPQPKLGVTKKVGSKPLPQLPPKPEPKVTKKLGGKPLPKLPESQNTTVVTKKPGTKPLPKLPEPQQKLKEPQPEPQKPTSKEETIQALLKDPQGFTLHHPRLDLAGARLAGANLARAILRGANLNGADLTGSDLEEIHLVEARLTRANLSGANLARAYLTKANLADANLARANLSGAILTGADLTGAVGLTEEQLASAKSLRGATLPDGTKSLPKLPPKPSVTKKVGAKPLPQPKTEEVEHEVEEVENRLEEQGRPLEKEEPVENQEHRVFPETEEIQQQRTDREEEVIRPKKRKPLPTNSVPQFGTKGPLSKEETLRELLKDPKRFTTRNFNLDLSGANLAGANLAGAGLADANLSGANLTGAKLGKAFLSHANLRGANLANADLREANTLRAIFAKANLTGALLGDAEMMAADLRGATLTNANLPGANLSGAFLRRADLPGANLRGANLVEADLSGANLTGADLRGASVDNAKFNGSILDDANMTGAEGLTEIQLGDAKSFRRLTVPDGQKHD